MKQISPSDTVCFPAHLLSVVPRIRSRVSRIHMKIAIKTSVTAVAETPDTNMPCHNMLIPPGLNGMI